MEITITTKAGKFVMKGAEFAGDFRGFLEKRLNSLRRVPETLAIQQLAQHLKDFLSTYEEEVKTEDCPACGGEDKPHNHM